MPLTTSRRLTRAGLFLTLSLMLLGSAARTASGATELTENIQGASNVGPFLNIIRSFVQERVAQIASDDPAAQSKSREELASKVKLANGQPASGAFLGAYAEILNEELLKISDHKDARVRLNAAIVGAVAEGAGNAKLLPLAQKLLADSSDGVVLWALKGARRVLPQALTNPGGAEGVQLVKAIEEVGRSRPAVVGEVYDALAIEPPAGRAGADKIHAAVIPAIHSVLKARIEQYNEGVPQEPLAEQRAAAHISAQNVWNAQNETQQRATAQTILNLLAAGAQCAADVPAEKRVELIMMINKVASAMVVIGRWEKSDSVQRIAQPAVSLPKQASAKEIQDAVQPIFPTVTSLSKFKDLEPPPKLAAMSANPGTPPPSTTSNASSGNPR